MRQTKMRKYANIQKTKRERDLHAYLGQLAGDVVKRVHVVVVQQHAPLHLELLLLLGAGFGRLLLLHAHLDAALGLAARAQACVGHHDHRQGPLGTRGCCWVVGLGLGGSVDRG